MELILGGTLFYLLLRNIQNRKSGGEWMMNLSSKTKFYTTDEDENIQHFRNNNNMIQNAYDIRKFGTKEYGAAIVTPFDPKTTLDNELALIRREIEFSLNNYNYTLDPKNAGVASLDFQNFKQDRNLQWINPKCVHWLNDKNNKNKIKRNKVL